MNLKEMDSQRLIMHLMSESWVAGANDRQVEKSKYQKELLSRIGKGERTIDRYELIRRLSPRDFSDIYQLNISTGKPFDEIIDNLLPFVRGAK